MRTILFTLLGVFISHMLNGQILDVTTINDSTFNLVITGTDEPEDLDSILLFNQMVGIVEGQFRRGANQLSQSDFISDQARKNRATFNTTFPDSVYFDYTKQKYKDRFLGDDWKITLLGSGTIIDMEMVESPGGAIRLREIANPSNFGTIVWYSANQFEFRNYHTVDATPVNTTYTLRVSSRRDTYFSDLTTDERWILRKRN